jgi:hypothetical protein
MSNQAETQEKETVRIEIDADEAFDKPIEVILGKKMHIVIKNHDRETSE